MNLKQSFDRAYATQLLPDAVLTGTGCDRPARYRATHCPAIRSSRVRQQGDVAPCVSTGTRLLGRAVSVPAEAQPAVSRLALRSGDLAGSGEVVTEEHLTEHYGLRPGDTVELLGPTGWQRRPACRVRPCRAEYFWPARSPQEVMTTPEHFGVVSWTAPDMQRLTFTGTG